MAKGKAAEYSIDDLLDKINERKIKAPVQKVVVRKSNREVRLQFRLPKDVKEEFQLNCDRIGTSMSEVLIKYLELYVEKYNSK